MAQAVGVAEPSPETRNYRRGAGLARPQPHLPPGTGLKGPLLLRPVGRARREPEHGARAAALRSRRRASLSTNVRGGAGSLARWGDQALAPKARPRRGSGLPPRRRRPAAGRGRPTGTRPVLSRVDARCPPLPSHQDTGGQGRRLRLVEPTPGWPPPCRPAAPLVGWPSRPFPREAPV